MVSLLVVDDETIIRRGLLTTLGKQEGLMVVGAAESGTDALRMVEQLQPDLVITDINMPNMDGLQLLEQLRAIDEDLTFIVLTGYDHFSYAQRALRAGAADYLLKPCAPSQLIEVVKREAQKIERRKERQRHTDWLEQQLAVQKQREKGMDVSQQMMNLIHQKWNDPCLTMDLVAEALGMNPNYLRDVFRTVNRMSFVKYIRCVRLQKAKDLLQNSDLQIQMIAKSVGYTDSAYFASCFRDAFGVSPSEFREKSMSKKRGNHMFVPRNEIQPEKLDELSERRIMAYDSELMLVEVSLKKNGVGAVHTHPHHQVDYLVSGRVEFNLNGEKRILLPGDSVVIPPNLPHGAFALEDSVLLDIFSPMREDFVKAERS